MSRQIVHYVNQNARFYSNETQNIKGFSFDVTLNILFDYLIVSFIMRNRRWPFWPLTPRVGLKQRGAPQVVNETSLCASTYYRTFTIM